MKLMHRSTKPRLRDWRRIWYQKRRKRKNIEVEREDLSRMLDMLQLRILEMEAREAEIDS